MTRRVPEKRPTPVDANDFGERLRAVMQFREQTGSTASSEEIWEQIQKQRQHPDSAGLHDYLRQAFEWAKSAGYARGMLLEEFEPGFRPKSGRSAEDSGTFRLMCGEDAMSLAALRWLIDHQPDVVELLRPALVAAFGDMRVLESQDEIWFPEGDAELLAFDRFSIDSIAVQQDRIVLKFDVPGDFFSDNECFAVIRIEQMQGFGTGNEVFAMD